MRSFRKECPALTKNFIMLDSITVPYFILLLSIRYLIALIALLSSTLWLWSALFYSSCTAFLFCNPFCSSLPLLFVVLLSSVLYYFASLCFLLLYFAILCSILYFALFFSLILYFMPSVSNLLASDLPCSTLLFFLSAWLYLTLLSYFTLFSTSRYMLWLSFP